MTGVLVSHRIKEPAVAGKTTTDVPRTLPTVDLPALHQAAERGDARAQDELGRVYAEGRGVKIDYSEAARWFRKAADQGDPSGLNHLGEVFEAGQGVPLNHDEAVKYYRAVARQDDPGGQYNLAVVYAFGRGVEKNDADAAGCYLKAARHGEALAQFNIGQRYDLGRGVPKDPIEAHTWLALAADQGHRGVGEPDGAGQAQAKSRPDSRGTPTSDRIRAGNEPAHTCRQQINSILLHCCFPQPIWHRMVTAHSRLSLGRTDRVGSDCHRRYDSSNASRNFRLVQGHTRLRADRSRIPDSAAGAQQRRGQPDPECSACSGCRSRRSGLGGRAQGANASPGSIDEIRSLDPGGAGNHAQFQQPQLGFHDHGRRARPARRDLQRLAARQI